MLRMRNVYTMRAGRRKRKGPAPPLPGRPGGASRATDLVPACWPPLDRVAKALSRAAPGGMLAELRLGGRASGPWAGNGSGREKWHFASSWAQRARRAPKITRISPFRVTECASASLEEADPGHGVERQEVSSSVPVSRVALRQAPCRAACRGQTARAVLAENLAAREGVVAFTEMPGPYEYQARAFYEGRADRDSASVSVTQEWGAAEGRIGPSARLAVQAEELVAPRSIGNKQDVPEDERESGHAGSRFCVQISPGRRPVLRTRFWLARFPLGTAQDRLSSTRRLSLATLCSGKAGARFSVTPSPAKRWCPVASERRRIGWPSS